MTASTEPGAIQPADLRTLIHVGGLNNVSRRPHDGTFEVGSGARLLSVYERLFRQYGVTIPGGVCYSVGAGGHVTGGGYGLLSRQHGLTVDHLRGVEVVTVRDGRRAELVYCSREDRGDLGDLFWAHTGGGGGNFGLVTRFDFATPGAERGLISPPATVQLVTCSWPWDGVTLEQFNAFLLVFTSWCQTHREPGSAADHVFPWLVVRHASFGGLGMVMQVNDPAGRDVADELVRDLGRALDRNDGPSYVLRQTIPWLNAVREIGTGSAENHDPNRRGKQGSANLRSGLTPAQSRHLYEAMHMNIPGSVSAGFDIAALGGAISQVAPDRTAVYQRDAIMKLLVQTFWTSAAQDEPNVRWLRHAYHGLFERGAPEYDARTAGSYINYPNSDLSDPALNRTGLSAGELYYGGNYERLRQVKRTWDPANHFRHAQSVEL